MRSERHLPFLVLAIAALLLAVVLAFVLRPSQAPPDSSPDGASPLDRLRLRPPPFELPAADSPPTRVEERYEATAPTAEFMDRVRQLGKALALGDEKLRRLLRNDFATLSRAEYDWLTQVAAAKGDPFAAIGALEIVRCVPETSLADLLTRVLRLHPVAARRQQAIELLRYIDAEQAQLLLAEQLRGPLDPLSMAAAIRTLCSIALPGREDMLLDILRTSPDAEIRREAAAGLLSLPSPTSESTIRTILRSESDPHVRLWLYVANPAEQLKERLQEDHAVLALLNLHDWSCDEVFSRTYHFKFFEDGGPVVPYDSRAHRQIGLLVDPGETNLELRDVSKLLFSEAPLDRYREFFFFRLYEELAEDLAAVVLYPRAYDYEGNAIAGGKAYRFNDSIVVLHLINEEDLPEGMRGYTVDYEAYVLPESLLHEVGHALGDLGDEYSSTKASQWEAVNLCPRDAFSWKWQGLIDQGFLPQTPPLRLEPKEGEDVGRFVIPSSNCFMNNHPTDDRFCPVCQLYLSWHIESLTR